MVLPGISILTGSVHLSRRTRFASCDMLKVFSSWTHAKLFAFSGAQKCAPLRSAISVHLPGLEPGITVPKTVVISVSLRVQRFQNSIYLDKNQIKNALPR